MTKQIGLVGCGEWGRFLLRDLKQLKCRVTVVCRSEKTRNYAEQGGADLIVHSVNDLGQIDGVVIAVPARDHFETIQSCLQYNVPIFVEKPMACRVADAEWLVKKYSDRLFVMDKWRYHPGVLKLADIVRSQELGALKGIKTIRFSSTNQQADIDMSWTVLPHDLVIIYELLGYWPKARCAVAHERGNETVSLTAFLGSDPWVVISVASIYPKEQREILLECENGVAILRDGYANEIEIYRSDDSREQPVKHLISYPSNEMPTLMELRAFITYLEGGPMPKSSAQEGLMVVKLINELRQLAGVQSSGIL